MSSCMNWFVVLGFLVCPISCLTGIKLFYYSLHSSIPVELQNIAIEDAVVDPTKQLKVICHGVAASHLVPWYDPLIEAYIGKGHQVLAIDWEQYAYDEYEEVVKVSYDIGMVIGDYITLIQNTFGLPFENVHIIGHSIGAHIVGFAGKHTFATTGLKIGRITGLDPCAPMFAEVPASEKLDVGDAEFVDVIHTDIDLVGIRDVIGHADFYPDGGYNQNGCSELGCSHNIAPVYLIESVNSDNFIANQCQSYLNYILQMCWNNPVAIMGEPCDTTASGVYYLTTNTNSPYGRG